MTKRPSRIADVKLIVAPGMARAAGFIAGDAS